MSSDPTPEMRALPPSEHLDSQVLQSLSEGLLDAAQAELAHAHLRSCALCQGEWEVWSQIFDELSQLPAFSPSADFSQRVLTLRSTAPVEGGTHLSPALLQDLLEGALAPQRQREIEAHLAACSPCRRELGQWTVLFEALGGLPEHRPSDGFGEVVLAKWTRAGDVRAAPLRLPSPKAALLWGFLALPTLGVLGLVLGVAMHPLLSLSGLLAFAQWKAIRLLEIAGGWLAEILVGALSAERLWELGSPLWGRPTLLLGASLAAWALACGAAWILYRQLRFPSPLQGSHASLSR